MTNPDQLAGVPVFFSAMLQALQFSGADRGSLQELTGASWQELLTFCDLAHLTLPLVMSCQDAAPAWVIARAGKNLADNRLRVERIKRAYREIAQAFEEDGIQHLVMKGFTQSPEFIEPLEYRMQSDIDLYCPEEFIPAAQASLTKLGYIASKTLGKYPADHLPEMTRRLGWQWRGNPYDPAMPPSVDLHFCFWNSAATRLSIEGVNDFWRRRVERRSGDFMFSALSSIDNLAFSALHILRDLQRGDWVLHHVYELAWFLDARVEDDAFWQSWLAGHDDSIRSFQAISFWLARDWFGCRLAGVIDGEIARLPRAVRDWLERFAKSPLMGMLQPNKHGVWLHLALLESRWDKLRVLGNTLMPLRLPAMGAPGQNATKSRRMRRIWPSQRYARYALHVVLRAGFHLQTLPDTLWHGLCWWLDQRRLRVL